MFGQGVNGIEASLAGFQPFTSFDAIIKFPDGGQIGPGGSGLETDANGNYGPQAFGAPLCGTWTLPATWSGGGLSSCSGSSPEVRDSGVLREWRLEQIRFPRNQSYCVAWVRRHRPS